MARHPTDHDNDKDDEKNKVAEKAAEERRQDGHRAEERQRQQPTPPPAPTTTEERPAAGDAPLKGVGKGDPVRLLVAHYDGFQRFEAGSIVHWWNDEPPTERNAALVDTPETPLSAPAMTDGKPPDGYTDPATGKKPVIGSV